ncbi:hypothetical protein [Amaricoccus sp.]|uniref:hypothetical protein n=1 Tax=Amaricoccus sp. TaxID=1872485 RepID=UPI001B6F6931|nr:hypothetical protein [Amaricoccus sp.]MBP7001463.1 hypothetical protein [Amaricoccus sp.]
MRSILFGVAFALMAPGLGAAAPLLTISDDTGRIGDVDLRTGAVTNLRRLDRNFTDLAYDPQGKLYGLDFSELSVIEGSTTREIGAHGMAGSANGLAFGRDGKLYGSSDALYTLDLGTGKSARVGPGNFTSSGDLAFVGRKLYLSSTTPIADTLVRVDAATGAGRAVGGFGRSGVFGLFARNGALFGVAGTSILRIDQATGAAAEIADYGGQGLGIAFGAAYSGEAVVPVPVPAAAPMLGAAVALLVGLGRRRGRRPAD